MPRPALQSPEQAHAFRSAFGLPGGPVMSPAEMHEAILKRGASFDLANGWRLARRRLMGADRVEIEGPADGRPRRAQAHGLRHRDRLVADPCVRTRIHRPRPHPRTLAARGCEPGVNPHAPVR